MNQGDFDQLLEKGTRRALTPRERQQLDGWLMAHPEARVAWTEELALSGLLDLLPDAAVTPRFTARVLAEVERLDPAAAPPGRRWIADVRSWLRRWRPAVAGLAVLVVGLGLSWHREARSRALLADRVAALSALAELPDLEALAEFELVYHLPTGPLPDEQELARAFE